jgi:predicted nucleic acid-binding protein
VTAGIVDTTVVLHYFRKHPAVIPWLEAQQSRPGVTPITRLEVLYGVSGKDHLATCKSILGLFNTEYLTPSDMEWAVDQMASHRLSRGVEINDCLIASVCYRLNVPIFTHNRKDFLKLLPARLVITPY